MRNADPFVFESTLATRGSVYKPCADTFAAGGLGYWQLCLPHMYSKTKNPLRSLVEGVQHGFIGSICEEDFSPFFAGAVDGSSSSATGS